MNQAEHHFPNDRQSGSAEPGSAGVSAAGGSVELAGGTPALPDKAAADCWHTIGVIGGDRSCAELARHTHCRNCSVFAEAGARLLDRALPAGYREEWTRRLAEAKTSAAVKKSVVVFRVGAEWLALPTPVFQEVAERRVIRPLPHQQNNFVLGLASVRGELLLCISIAGLLGIKTEAVGNTRRPAYDRLLVVGRHGQRLALPVAEVLGVQRYVPAEVTELPSGGAFAATCVGGMLKLKGRAVGLLDAEIFFIAVDRSFA